MTELTGAMGYLFEAGLLKRARRSGWWIAGIRAPESIECLIQAVEYQAQGVTTVKPWIDSSLAALKTDTARALAEEALNTHPLGWQKTRRDQRTNPS